MGPEGIVKFDVRSHLGWPETYFRVLCDSECVGHGGLPSMRARSLFVGDLPLTIH